MKIKGLLGFCECKGCKKLAGYKMDVVLEAGGEIKRKKSLKICKEHALEQIQKVKEYKLEHPEN